MDETIRLTRKYHLELLWMADDNFLVDLDRALKIAEGLIRAGGDFKWSIQATTESYRAADRRRTAHCSAAPACIRSARALRPRRRRS